MVSYSIFTSPSNLLFFSIGYSSSTTTAGFSIFWHAPAFTIFAYFPKMVSLTKEKLFNFQCTDCQLLTTCHLFGSGSPLLSSFSILAPSKPPVNDFSILHLLYIYRYSVIYPPHIYNSMLSTYGAQFQGFCIPSFYVNSL